MSQTDDHLTEARYRAREILSGEAHVGDVDDWRRALVSARDATVIVWLLWIAALGYGWQSPPGPLLLAVGFGVSLYLGISTAVATRVRLRHYESELERERMEVHDHPEHEREEVRRLYAAKGFREPLLGQITDVLCGDDDRLLKVMMEEELGLFIRHMHHPVLVGLWNALAGAAAISLLAVPICALEASTAVVWTPVGVTVVLLALSTVNARWTERELVPLVVSWFAMAAVAGGAAYFLAALSSGRG